MLHVVSAKYLEDFKLWVCFNDGTAGEVDLRGKLSGPVFDPLKQEAYFAKVYVDQELETVAWPNGADLSPEFLKDNLAQVPS